MVAASLTTVSLSPMVSRTHAVFPTIKLAPPAQKTKRGDFPLTDLVGPSWMLLHMVRNFVSMHLSLFSFFERSRSLT